MQNISLCDNKTQH